MNPVRIHEGRGHSRQNYFCDTVKRNDFPGGPYVGQNEYLHKCNIKETDLCKCGAKETLSHFLLECQEFDTTRELMRKRIFETCGITHLDLSLLLDAKEDDEFKDWRSFMLSELENFVVGTRRFATRQ